MPVFARLLDFVEREGAAALVTLSRTQGSTPRGTDAFMIVTLSGGFSGTIGGGALEWAVLHKAREALARGETTPFAHALGPDLGQCCGGNVRGLIEVFSRADAQTLRALGAAEGDPSKRIVLERGPRDRRSRRVADAASLQPGACVEDFAEAPTPVFLFGAGHVGRALALALASLPFQVTWVDERAEAFPSVFPPNALPVHAADAPAEIAHAPDGAYIVAMTHSHDLDFRVVHAALRAGRFGFVGLIGSQTKRARFFSRLAALGVEDAAQRLTCPIGLPHVNSKLPAVIAATTASQLLALRYAAAAQRHHQREHAT